MRTKKKPQPKRRAWKKGDACTYANALRKKNEIVEIISQLNDKLFLIRRPNGICLAVYKRSLS
jgi:hypothetical protein